MKCCIALSVYVVFFSVLVDAVAPRPGNKKGSAKWVFVSTNLLTTSPAQILSIVDRAKAEGANGVLFDDTKALTFWFRSPGAKWFTNMRAVRNGIRSRGMDFILTGIGLGYCQAPLSRNQNLAAGYPLRDVKMVVRGGKLRPVQSARIPNGGFESASGNVPTNWGFQDSPGTATFIDSRVAHTGSNSLRFDLGSNEKARLFGDFAVKPFNQYTITVWVKTNKLTAGDVLVLIRNGANVDSRLSDQYLSTPRAGGGRRYFNSANRLTIGWTKMKLAFNSQRASSISLVLGVFKASSGQIWWDDVSIASTPLLNLLRRPSLPFVLEKKSGAILKEKVDYSYVRDSKLGRSVSNGIYDTYHAPPTISLRSSAGLSNGEVVLLRGYHTMITLSGQVGCSWSAIALHNLVRRTYAEMSKKFNPDGYLLAHDEIRTGGWEPAEIAAGTSGNALARYMRRELRDVRQVTRNKPLYIWSDMFDPTHNARANYYQVRGTLVGSWNGLDKTKVVILNWNGGVPSPTGKASVDFFARKGFTQISAAFYDTDVTTNYNRWQSAIGGRLIAGSMYTTFAEDYSKLKRFGNLWW